MSISIKENDLLIGEMNEDLLVLFYKDNYNTNLIKTTDYHPMDFTNEDESMFIELKSRNNNYNKYPTTMIGHNKFIFAEKCKKDIYFIIAFNDGLYSYKYSNKDIFEIVIGGRKDRGYIESKKYVMIPISKFTKID